MGPLEGDLGKGLTTPTLGLGELKALTLGTQKTRGWGLAPGSWAPEKLGPGGALAPVSQAE